MMVISSVSSSSSKMAALLFVLTMMITLTSMSTALQLKRIPTSSSLSSSSIMMTQSSLSSSQRRNGATGIAATITVKQQFVRVRGKEDNYYLSDIPKQRRDNDNNDNDIINNKKKNDEDIDIGIGNDNDKIKDKFNKNILKMKETFYASLPPPPEDQFIMTGDIVVLFLYAFTSHSLNDYIVSEVLSRQDISLVEAVHELDPTGIIVNTNSVPSWVDTTQSSVAINHALDVSARESLLNHWGPLLSTEGSACVALCTCWLIAGYIHRAFLYKNTAYCDSSQALVKTIQTWFTSALLLTLLTISTDFLVTHVTGGTTQGIIEGGLGYGSIIPLSRTETGLSILSSLTQSDVTFIVDSLTVLIAWRWTANRILNSL